MKPKFNIGQLVKEIDAKDSSAGKVVSFAYDPERGFSYKVTSKEVDMELKEIINGFITCNEKELVAVKGTDE